MVVPLTADIGDCIHQYLQEEADIFLEIVSSQHSYRLRRYIFPHHTKDTEIGDVSARVYR